MKNTRMNVIKETEDKRKSVIGSGKKEADTFSA